MKKLHGLEYENNMNLHEERKKKHLPSKNIVVGWKCVLHLLSSKQGVSALLLYPH